MALTLREGEAEQAGGGHRVVEEELKEVAEPEQKQRIAGQRPFHLEVLLQHRGDLLGVGHGGGSKVHQAGRSGEVKPIIAAGCSGGSLRGAGAFAACRRAAGAA
jgi:hypothetical protein